MCGMIPNITNDDNKFNGGSIEEYTTPSEECIERRAAPTADVQSVGIGGNLRRRLAFGNYDTVDRTTVPVSEIFDRFRNMCLNSLESDYIRQADVQLRRDREDTVDRTSVHVSRIFDCFRNMPRNNGKSTT
nr:hypothetical protein [Tanacetum cinerariifolium]